MFDHSVGIKRYTIYLLLAIAFLFNLDLFIAWKVKVHTQHMQKASTLQRNFLRCFSETRFFGATQLTFTCSKSTIETLEKYAPS